MAKRSRQPAEAAEAPLPIHVWTTREGRQVPITEMTDAHLNSAIRFIADREGLRAKWGTILLAERDRRDRLAGIPTAAELLRAANRSRGRRRPVRRSEPEAPATPPPMIAAIEQAHVPVVGRRRNVLPDPDEEER